MHKVVILGARFGGSAVAYWIHQRFSRRELDVTVVDQWDVMTYRPAMVVAASGSPRLADQWHIAIRRRVEAAGFHFVRDNIFCVDPERQLVHLAGHRPLPYDTLFMATGTDPGWATIPGLGPEVGGLCEDYLARATAEKISRPFRSYTTAIGPIRLNPQSRPHISASLDAPGFEVTFLVDARLRREHRRHGVSMTVITPASTPGEWLNPASQEFLARELKRRDIALITKARYTRASPHAIFLQDRKPVRSDVTVWIPPYHGSELARISHLDDGYGWIPTDEYLVHEHWPNIYAVGDISSRAVPKLAHIALMQARIATQHFHALRSRGRPEPFDPYVLHGVWAGQGRGLLTKSRWIYGGGAGLTHVGAASSLAKAAFDQSYRLFSGWFGPIMP